MPGASDAFAGEGTLSPVEFFASERLSAILGVPTPGWTGHQAAPAYFLPCQLSLRA